MNVPKEEEIIYQSIYCSLKLVFENDSDSFTSEVKNVLECSSNPFAFFCVCIKKDEDYISNKTSTFLSLFIQEFDAFIMESKSSVSELLTQEIQLEAFSLFTNFKHSALQNATIRSFSLDVIPHLILPLLLKMLKANMKKKDTVNMLSKLKYNPKVVVNEIIIPLFLEDKISFLEEILDKMPSLQLEFIDVLDKLVGNKIELEGLMTLCGVKQVKGDKSSRSVFKLALRLMKKFNVDLENYPHILHRHKLASMRYLFRKHYFENDLALESLIKFADETCNDNIPLIADVLHLFVEYDDCFSGVNFIKNKTIPSDQIPAQISVLLSDKRKLNEHHLKHIKRSQSHQLNPNFFFSLPVECKEIQHVNSKGDFLNVIEEINTLSLIGIDTENKPALIQNEEEQLMLLQIASCDKVYLLDLLFLKNLLSTNDYELLGKVFSNPRIQKLTYSFEGDIRILKGFHPLLEYHLNNIKNMLDLHQVKQILLDKCPQIFPYLENASPDLGHKGLSELVYLCFGKPLNKREQCSYWSARPLTNDQVTYAALDAFCLISVLNLLRGRSKEVNIPFVEEIIEDNDILKLENLKLVDKKSRTSSSRKKDRKNRLKNKASPHMKTVKPSQSIYAPFFKVVCDSMLQGLGKQMRYCNIDTAILKPHEDHQNCISLYEKEQRIVLTRGMVYQSLRKYVPASHIMSIQSDNTKVQLEEVVNRFGVIIREEDIFVRCGECNSSRFSTIEPRYISSMKIHGNKGSPPSWITVDNGKSKVDILNGLTSSGIKIKHNEVPFELLDRLNTVYVCQGCGKCFWDGSHLNKMRSNIGHLIQKSGSRNLVPGPKLPDS